MTSTNFATGLEALIQGNLPQNSLEAVELMSLMAGASCALAEGIDQGNGYPMDKAPNYVEKRHRMQAAGMYLTATAVPELSCPGMSMMSAVEAVGDMIVEKILFAETQGNNTLGQEALSALVVVLARVFVFGLSATEHTEAEVAAVNDKIMDCVIEIIQEKRKQNGN